ncbi:MAG: glycerol-3-phosphate 1-O-acyltransferase PlsY [Chitinophagaceae bacterium]|nr:glycerol-3-phosphate 1-O-acyltransferase PlsY [Chitinophagaceae bacterium]MBK9530629.1 glycerol-3-phosphate 1-O-acyltransferase PlsY [Chitinophagaceae bacterium]
MKELALIILSYLIGSIPTALIISRRFFGIDIRDYGSGNMGATNTFRVLGSRYGTMVMVFDILKGMAAVMLYNFLPFYVNNDLERTNLMLGLGLSAVIGHVFPVFAGFKGGKGVATLLGMVLAIQPVIAVSCIGIFILVLFLTRYVSLSSILAAVALPICVLWIWNENELLYRVFALIVAILVVVTHQKNIGRILRGVESRVPIFKNRDKRKTRRNNG